MPKTVLILNEAAEDLCKALRQARPDYVYRAAKTPEEAIACAADVEILMAFAGSISASLVQTMPKLEWIHALTAGYETLVGMEGLSPGVAISTSRGMHGPQMAELAVLMMMALPRRIAEVLRNQQRARWERWTQSLLLDKTACIVGLGAIAEALADRLRPFGMRLTGVSNRRSEMPGFARVFPRDQLADAVAEADFVVVVVPHSPETHHLIDDTVLAAMKPSACLVNIARGACVDETALIEHLRSGSIAGAGLDVFEVEPLPADSPLWSLPNVIVTPHVGGYSDVYYEQALPIIVANLKGYTETGPDGLVNRIERI